MTPERWQRVQALFERAADVDGDARERVLAEAEDPELRREVEALLAADDGADDFVDGGAVGLFDAVSTELTPGTTLQDYVVEARVGAGAFGVVYRAVHPVIDKRAAVKVLDPTLSRDPHHVSRFITEARAVNAIGHAGIVGAFGFGRTERGAFYCLMDFVDGETLDAHLASHGRLSLEAAIPILAGIASALDAAHAAGIVHRDLKPANVMIGPGGPRLLDFGIAKLLAPKRATDHRTETGQTVGTPAYMAPEQIEGKDVDARTDAYAFGVLAYELLTGTRPFEGTSSVATMMKHLQVDPDPPSRRAPELSSHVDAVLLGLLAKRAEDRPPDLGAGVEALASPPALTSPPEITSAPTKIAKEPPAPPRRLLPFAAAAMVIVGVGVAALWSPESKPAPVAAPVVTPTPPTRVSIVGAPEGTAVFDAETDTRIGSAPGPFEVEAPRAVRLEAEGYTPRTITLDPSHATIDGALERVPVEPPPPPRRVHPDLEPM